MIPMDPFNPLFASSRSGRRRHEQLFRIPRTAQGEANDAYGIVAKKDDPWSVLMNQFALGIIF